MSRIGRTPVPVPSGVSVALDGRSVTVTGPRGALSHQVAGEITVRQDQYGISREEAPGRPLPRSSQRAAE